MRRPRTDPFLAARRTARAGRRAALGKRPPTRLLREHAHPPPALPGTLRLLTFNIQAGIRTERYREYVTRGWRQLVHDDARQANLASIGDVLAGHDVVALQEVDAGSLRSGFTNQVAWLAARAGLDFWYAQRNRRLGRFAQHGNGLLACCEPLELVDAPLPSAIPGRGAIVARFRGPDDAPVTVVSAHLSLGPRSRNRQLGWIADAVAGAPRVVLMGDFNVGLDELLSNTPLRDAGLAPALSGPGATWPSWRPRLDLDHVLCSPDLMVRDARALPCPYSDHLPISVRIDLA